MRLLWVIDLEYEHEMRHGASLRCFNLARQLILLGHQVYFASNRRSSDDPVKKAGFLERLRGENFLSGHFETTYAPDASVRRFAQLALYPPVVNWLLRRCQRPTIAQVREFVRDHRIDACIVSNRSLLFLVPAIRDVCPTCIDWIDCMVLFWLREMRLNLGRGRLTHILYFLRRLLEAYIEESCYGRHCDANLTVSPVDRLWLDTINRRPQRNWALLNGVQLRGERPAVEVVKNRLIFSGNMSFPPNYEGAIWFIDKVMPLLRNQRPGIVFVAAGANPVAPLLARRSADVVVTGLVEDLDLEISWSELYVAPLVSGGGFKNKVVEAIVAGKYVVGTRRASEFLDLTAKSYLPACDTPAAMAESILSCLENPANVEAARVALHRLVHEEFSWRSRAEELLRTIHGMADERETDLTPDAAGTPMACRASVNGRTRQAR